MGRRQKSHSAEDIDCADVLLTRQSGFRSPNNALLKPVLTIRMQHSKQRSMDCVDQERSRLRSPIPFLIKNNARSKRKLEAKQVCQAHSHGSTSTAVEANTTRVVHCWGQTLNRNVAT